MNFSIEEVAEEFKAWRASRKSPKQRIPEDLAKKARSLVGRHSRNEVCRQLGLGASFFAKKIKKLGSAKEPVSAREFLTSEFVKVMPPPSSSAKVLGVSGKTTEAAVVTLEVTLKSGVTVRFY